MNPFASINERLNSQENRMSQFEDDVQRLNSEVAENAQKIEAVAGLVANDRTQIAALKAEVDALKGQVSPDLTALEAGIAELEANNDRVAAILAPPEAPVA